MFWTRSDLFVALVVGPVLRGLETAERASVFERFTPKMTFLMPTLALVTILGGITLAMRMGLFEHAHPWIALFSTVSVLPALLLIGHQFDALRDRRWLAAFGIAAVAHGAYLATTLPDFALTSPSIMLALAIVTVLTVLGFGVLLSVRSRARGARSTVFCYPAKRASTSRWSRPTPIRT